MRGKVDLPYCASILLAFCRAVRFSLRFPEHFQVSQKKKSWTAAPAACVLKHRLLVGANRVIWFFADGRADGLLHGRRAPHPAGPPQCSPQLLLLRGLHSHAPCRGPAVLAQPLGQCRLAAMKPKCKHSMRTPISCTRANTGLLEQLVGSVRVTRAAEAL